MGTQITITQAQLARLGDRLEEEDLRYFFTPRPVTGFHVESNKGCWGMKPAGLWYACGSGWADLLASNEDIYIQLARKRYRYLYEIRLGVDILALPTARELLAFSEQWADSRGFDVNWGAVAERHAGIEICPYQRGAGRDRTLSWYHSWDVASGCVWAPRGVADMRLLATHEDGWR